MPRSMDEGVRSGGDPGVLPPENGTEERRQNRSCDLYNHCSSGRGLESGCHRAGWHAAGRAGTSGLPRAPSPSIVPPGPSRAGSNFSRPLPAPGHRAGGRGGTERPKRAKPGAATGSIPPWGAASATVYDCCAAGTPTAASCHCSHSEDSTSQLSPTTRPLTGGRGLEGGVHDANSSLSSAPLPPHPPASDGKRGQVREGA